MTAPGSGVVRWRKRPVVIEAVRWTGSNLAQVQAFTGPDHFRPAAPGHGTGGRVKTAEVYDYLHDTWVGVYDGQQVIRGVKDELYPIDDSALADSYDPVGSGDDLRTDGEVFYEAFSGSFASRSAIHPRWGQITAEGRRQYEAGAAAVAARALGRKAPQ